MRMLVSLLLLLAACNREEQPEAPTPEETERLNETEAMLNELASNEEGPATESAGASNSN